MSMFVYVFEVVTRKEKKKPNLRLYIEYSFARSTAAIHQKGWPPPANHR